VLFNLADSHAGPRGHVVQAYRVFNRCDERWCQATFKDTKVLALGAIDLNDAK
jgi:hypothetical protein